MFAPKTAVGYGDLLPLNGCTVHLLQQGHHTPSLQEVEEVIQPRPFVQPIHPRHQLLPVQAACDPGIVAPGGLLTQPLRQVLRDLVVCLPHGQVVHMIGSAGL
jgi:hypothetical protein